MFFFLKLTCQVPKPMRGMRSFPANTKYSATDILFVCFIFLVLNFVTNDLILLNLRTGVYSDTNKAVMRESGGARCSPHKSTQQP